MASHRKNTLVVDFSVLPKRPILEQVEEFLRDIIKLDLADVKNIQLHNIKNCVFIEMNGAGVAPRLQQQHHLRHFFEYQGVRYFIPVYVDGPTTTVRIHDLPPQMCNKAISNHLQQCGKVISIQNEVWKNYFSGIPNGVRVVRMKVEKQIPSYIVVNNHGTYVSCPNKSDQSTAIDAEKLKQKAPSNSIKQKRNCDKQRDTVDTPAQATPAETDNDDDEDDNHNESNNNNDKACENETATDYDSTKRRLSTESNGTREENIAKRSCNQETIKTDQEWKVITRSKKKTNY